MFAIFLKRPLQVICIGLFFLVKPKEFFNKVCRNNRIKFINKIRRTVKIWMLVFPIPTSVYPSPWRVAMMTTFGVPQADGVVAFSGRRGSFGFNFRFSRRRLRYTANWKMPLHDVSIYSKTFFSSQKGLSSFIVIQH